MTDQPGMSSKFNNVILIPVDFSAIAENAIVHGLELAQLLHDRVCLLHVLAGKSDTIINKDSAAYQDIHQDLLKCKERCEQKYAVKIDPLIREGNLFKVVHSVAGEIKPRLMVMGTHGKQGLQHLFGSHALRMILDAPCPAMVVQGRSSEPGYRRIVLPISSDVGPGPMIEWVLLLGRLFDPEVHLFQAREINPDGDSLTKGIISQIINALKEKKISFTITLAESVNDFSNQVVAFANAKRSDLVMAMTMPATDATGYSFSDWNERLMFNADHIPVLFIDRTDTTG